MSQLRPEFRARPERYLQARLAIASGSGHRRTSIIARLSTSRSAQLRPLTITVLAAQNAQGFVVLEAAGHKPPVNAVTVACGLGSLISALVGSVSTCLTGPVSAIISSAGNRERHCAAGVLVALFAMLFGIFAPVVMRLMLATPKAFIATLAGTCAAARA